MDSVIIPDASAISVQNIQAPISLTPIPPPSNLYIPHRPPVDPNDENDEIITDNKPIVHKVLAILIFIIAVLYALKSFSLLWILIIFDFSSSGILFSLLREFPNFGVLPITYGLIAIYFAFIAFRVLAGSKSNLKLTFFSLLILPIASSYLTLQLLKPLAELVSNFKESGTGIATSVNNSFNIFDPLLILPVIAIILLSVFYKKFEAENIPLSKTAKIILAVVTVIIILPIFSILALNIVRALDTNYGYAKVAKIAGFHVYKPVHEPEGLAYATKFTSGKELAGKQNAIQVAFDIPYDQIMSGEQTQPIVVRQVEVEPDFNLRSYVASSIPNAEPEPYPIPSALNQTGYVLQKPLGNSNLSAIVYVTEDNILIEIMSPKVALDRLIQVSEALQ